MQWIRTTKQNKCPVCGHDSWCILNPDLKLLICMRVQSQKPKIFKDGSQGWIHSLEGQTSSGQCYQPKPPDPPAINCRKLIEQWIKSTTSEQVVQLSQLLQVSLSSLRALQVCWSPEHRAWAIPMKDGYDNMVGIRLRANNGDKWAVRGSHQGCFVPLEKRPGPMALVCEGFSDTCAGLDLGFYTVGRPCASGGIDQLKHLFRMKGVRKAVIVCDNDAPGVRGARICSEHLGVANCLIILPTKDLREFVQAGGDKTLLESLVSQSIWHHV